MSNEKYFRDLAPGELFSFQSPTSDPVVEPASYLVKLNEDEYLMERGHGTLRFMNFEKSRTLVVSHGMEDQANFEQMLAAWPRE
ncbi:MAG: hypothetical protein JWN89_400 [Parcubacteria group bacterium]|nr:hypothetical protein [Parcubacteria group bacterium]